MGLPKQKNKMDIKDRLKALPVKSETKEDTLKLEQEPYKADTKKESSKRQSKKNKKEAGRPSAFNEPTEKLLVTLSVKTAEQLAIIHAQEQVKYKQKGIALCKGKLIDIALQEYFKKLGY